MSLQVMAEVFVVLAAAAAAAEIVFAVTAEVLQIE